MRRRAGQPVQRRTRLEAQWNGTLTREVNDLLEPRSAGAFGNQHTLQRTARTQSFGDRVDSRQNHSSGFNSRPLLKRLVKSAIAATSVISTIGAELKYSISASR